MQNRCGSRVGLVLTAVAAAVVMAPAVWSAEPGRGAAREAEESAEREPKVTGISVAISTLRREVTDGRRDARGWPRSEANFAQDKNWDVPDDQVIRGLKRRLHPNPAIHGYIKWQLLSFEPDMSGLDEDTARRIISSMPMPLGEPEPDLQRIRRSDGTKLVFGRQVSHLAGLRTVVGPGVAATDPELGVMSRGSGLSRGGRGRVGINRGQQGDPAVRAERKRTAIRRADYQLERAQESVDLANEPVRAYRDQLIELLPTRKGLRLEAMIRDVEDRLEAGDLSFREKLRRLVDVSRVQATDESITPKRRRILLGRANRLKSMRTEVVRSLSYDRDAKLVARKETLRAPEEEVERLLKNLKGEPFER